MDFQSERVLRQRDKAVVYFPKQLLYTVVPEGTANYRAGSRRRSKSTDHSQTPKSRPARRMNRCQSLDQSGYTERLTNRLLSIEERQVPARRGYRFQSVEGRRAVDDVAFDTVGHLAQAQATLTMELIKIKDQLDAKKKQVEMLLKQDVANQQLIANMIKDGEEKDAELARLQDQLHFELQYQLQDPLRVQFQGQLGDGLGRSRTGNSHARLS